MEWKIGDVKVTRVQEREVPVPGAGLIPDMTAEHVERHRSWLHPNFLDDDGNLRLSVHALVVEVGDRRIVVDTCMGNRVNGPYEFAPTDFLTWFEEAGFARESIDTVVCTHLHFDHVGWNTMWDDAAQRWVPTFPNARYLFAQAEWDHWQTTESDNVFLGDTVQPIVDGGLADLVATDHRICDEVRLVPSPGHTPGHVCVVIASGGEQAVITGDMTHHPIQLAEPQLASAPDSDRTVATATRRAFTAEHGGTATLVIGTHYGGATAGRLVRFGDTWRLDVDA
jgi:glyoxylase-like metal-dependent hydrolase (beta-lactamase superfamily II)